VIDEYPAPDAHVADCTKASSTVGSPSGPALPTEVGQTGSEGEAKRSPDVSSTRARGDMTDGPFADALIASRVVRSQPDTSRFHSRSPFASIAASA